MPQFKSVGASAGRALEAFLVDRELRRRAAREEARQSMLDGLSVENQIAARQRAEQEMALRQAAEQRAQAEHADRVRRLDEARIEKARGASAADNTARNLDVINASVADAIASGGIDLNDPTARNTVRAKYLASGLAMPKEVDAMLTPPKPEAPVKLDIREHESDQGE